jgi:hypothetical protein
MVFYFLPAFMGTHLGTQIEVIPIASFATAPPAPTFCFCETDSAAQVIKWLKAQSFQTAIHKPKPFGHAHP